MNNQPFSRFDRWRRRNGLVFEGVRWPPVLYQVVAWYGGLSDARAGLFHVTALLFAAATAFYLFGAANLLVGERSGGTTPAIAFPAFEVTETPDLPTETALPTLPPRPTVTLPPAVIERPLSTRVPPPPVLPTEPPVVTTDTPVPPTAPAGTPPTIAVITATRIPVAPTVPSIQPTSAAPTSVSQLTPSPAPTRALPSATAPLVAATVAIR